MNCAWRQHPSTSAHLTSPRTCNRAVSHMGGRRKGKREGKRGERKSGWEARKREGERERERESASAVQCVAMKQLTGSKKGKGREEEHDRLRVSAAAICQKIVFAGRSGRRAESSDLLIHWRFEAAGGGHSAARSLVQKCQAAFLPCPLHLFTPGATTSTGPTRGQGVGLRGAAVRRARSPGLGTGEA